MNRRNTCPDIPDDWKGSVADVCRMLGGNKPIDRKTVVKYMRQGDIEAEKGLNKHWRITGEQVKRLWSML